MFWKMLAPNGVQRKMPKRVLAPLLGPAPFRSVFFRFCRSSGLWFYCCYSETICKDAWRQSKSSIVFFYTAGWPQTLNASRQRYHNRWRFLKRRRKSKKSARREATANHHGDGALSAGTEKIVQPFAVLWPPRMFWGKLLLPTPRHNQMGTWAYSSVLLLLLLQLLLQQQQQRALTKSELKAVMWTQRLRAKHHADEVEVGDVCRRWRRAAHPYTPGDVHLLSSKAM